MFQSLFVLVYLVGAAAAALHALLTKPDPRSVISWIALCWLFPLGGSILYWLFGINRVATSGRPHGQNASPHRPAVEQDRGAGRFRPHLNARIKATLERPHIAPCRLGRIEGLRRVAGKYIFEHVAHAPVGWPSRPRSSSAFEVAYETRM